MSKARRIKLTLSTLLLSGCFFVAISATNAIGDVPRGTDFKIIDYIISSIFSLVIILVVNSISNKREDLKGKATKEYVDIRIKNIEDKINNYDDLLKEIRLDIKSLLSHGKK